MKNNFVLVDFENIQPKNISLLSGGPFKIKVFLGANQGKIPVEMARALQMFGPDAEYITIDGTGRNALDFHIAYYIGRLAVETPGAYLHVISKDKGFDPLIKYLTDKTGVRDKFPLICLVLKSARVKQVRATRNSLYPKAPGGNPGPAC